SRLRAHCSLHATGLRAARSGTIVALNTSMRPRPSMSLCALSALALAASPAWRGETAAASELRASAANVSGVIVHDASETLRDYCRSDGGRLFLELPGGTRWELVTSTTDPIVTNPGDGSFHA